MPKPYKTSYLNSKTGHKIYYSLYGNPVGIPVLIFHGGPGSFSKPYHIGRLNLTKYHVIMFDQPGCGKSTPLGRIKNNNTQIILEIAEELLYRVGIWSQADTKPAIIVKGRSWGATLALLFAIKHSENVKTILLQSLFVATREAADYIFSQEIKKFLPERKSLINQIENSTKLNLQKAFEILTVSDKEFKAENIQVKQATWLLSAYYWPSSTFVPNFKLPFENITTEAVLGMRIFAHYDKNDYFLPKNFIKNNINKIKNIPLLLIHSRYDLDSPIGYAYEIIKDLENSQTVITHHTGHRGGNEVDQIEAVWIDRLLGL